MSVEAMSWAANLPLEIVSDPGARHVLMILGNHARNDGRAAFPSVATLMRCTGMSRRTVQGKLGMLRRIGVIKQGNQAIAHALGLPADRTPVVYDLCMFGEITPLHDVERGAESAPRADNNVTGRNLEHDGAQITTQRGADSAPKPSRTITPTHSDAGDTNPDRDDSGTPNQVFERRQPMTLDWQPDPEQLRSALLHHGLPIDTELTQSLLADFTAHYADRPGMEKSANGWVYQLAKWVKNEKSRSTATAQPASGGRNHENRQPPRRHRRTAAEARAAAEAQRSGGSGRVFEGERYVH